MQPVVFKIGFSGMLLLLLWLALGVNIPFADAETNKNVEAIRAFFKALPISVWLLAPLLMCVLAAIATELGLLQKLFGDLHKDLTNSRAAADSHLRTSDRERLQAVVSGWSQRQSALSRADGWLACWTGKDHWSIEGLYRCWVWALIYPSFILLFLWVVSNQGRLGNAVVIPSHPSAWVRAYSAMFLCIGTALMVFAMQIILRDTDADPGWLQRIPTIHRLLGRWPDSNLTAAAFLAAFAAPAAAALAFAAAFLAAFAAALAFAVAFAADFAADFAAAGAFAPAATFVVAMFLAVAGAVAVTAAFKAKSKRMRSVASQSWSFIAPLGLFLGALIGLGMLAILQFSAWGVAMKASALQSDSESFILLTFLAALPFVNTLSDWLSVNATREFLARARVGAKRGNVARFYLYDFLIALLLTFFVYAATLAILYGMQSAGWQVDVRSILTALRDDPWGGSSAWLLLMAVTNFIPTIVHLVLYASNRAQPRTPDVLADIQQFLSSGGTQATHQIAPTIIYVLRIQRWLELATIASLTLALVPLFAICLPWAAGWLLEVLPQ
jgi:hypothetical protein